MIPSHDRSLQNIAFLARSDKRRFISIINLLSCHAILWYCCRLWCFIKVIINIVRCSWKKTSTLITKRFFLSVGPFVRCFFAMINDLWMHDKMIHFVPTSNAVFDEASVQIRIKDMLISIDWMGSTAKMFWLDPNSQICRLEATKAIDSNEFIQIIILPKSRQHSNIQNPIKMLVKMTRNAEYCRAILECINIAPSHSRAIFDFVQSSYRYTGQWSLVHWLNWPNMD